MRVPHLEHFFSESRLRYGEYRAIGLNVETHHRQMRPKGNMRTAQMIPHNPNVVVTSCSPCTHRAKTGSSQHPYCSCSAKTYTVNEMVDPCPYRHMPDTGVGRAHRSARVVQAAVGTVLGGMTGVAAPAQRRAVALWSRSRPWRASVSVRGKA